MAAHTKTSFTHYALGTVLLLTTCYVLIPQQVANFLHALSNMVSNAFSPSYQPGPPSKSYTFAYVIGLHQAITAGLYLIAGWVMLSVYRQFTFAHNLSKQGSTPITDLTPLVTNYGGTTLAFSIAYYLTQLVITHSTTLTANSPPIHWSAIHTIGNNGTELAIITALCLYTALVSYFNIRTNHPNQESTRTNNPSTMMITIASKAALLVIIAQLCETSILLRITLLIQLALTVATLNKHPLDNHAQYPQTPADNIAFVTRNLLNTILLFAAMASSHINNSYQYLGSFKKDFLIGMRISSEHGSFITKLVYQFHTVKHPLAWQNDMLQLLTKKPEPLIVGNWYTMDTSFFQFTNLALTGGILFILLTAITIIARMAK